MQPDLSIAPLGARGRLEIDKRGANAPLFALGIEARRAGRAAGVPCSAL